MFAALTLTATLHLMNAQAIPQHVATTPVHRLADQWWKDRHENCVKITQAKDTEIVFLGDSITQGWETTGKAAFEKHFAHRKVGNFGFSGDRTEHVLWRLENGEIMGLDPKLIVILIGTNNVGHGSSTPTQTIDGVQAILSKLRTGLPQAEILLLSVFPRAEQASDPLRKAVVEISAGTKKFTEADPKIHWLDIGDKFINADGSIKKEILPDALHLTPEGYEIWAQSMIPVIDKIIQQ